MKIQSVLPLLGLYIFHGFQQVISTNPDYRDYESFEIWSVENLLSKIDQINVRLQNIENVQRQAAKDKEEILAEQNNLRNKIEQILTYKKEEKQLEESRHRQMEVEIKLNIEIENLKAKLANKTASLDEAIKLLESKEKEIKKYKTEERNFCKKINERNLEVSSLNEKLEESETQLTDLNHLLERQLNRTKEDLIECQKRIPETGCKGLSSGIHEIEIPGIDPISALCEGDIEGGGWIVIHKRFDGSVDFNRTWTEYRDGFGEKETDFFIGLENLHLITNSQTYELYVQLEYDNGNYQFASYNNFRIGNEGTKYKLESLGEFRGTAIDAMKYNLNDPFSTFDQDNDQFEYFNCGQIYGAWWHKRCSSANFNGKYFNREVDGQPNMSWWTWISLKSDQMLIRPK